MKRLALLLGVMVSQAAVALTTNLVDLAALSACGTGVTNGWTVSGVISADGSGNFKLRKNASYATSRNYPMPIRSFRVTIRTSDPFGRKLVFIPCSSPAYDAATCIAWTCTTTNHYEDLTATWPTPTDATSFTIRYEGGGSASSILKHLEVITDDDPGLTHDFDLQITGGTATNRAVSWRNPQNCLSNRITLAELKSDLGSPGTLLDFYDFSTVTNTYSQSKDCTEAFLAAYPYFDGTGIYAAANSTNTIQTGTGKDKGMLIYRGPGLVDSAWLRITAARYAGDTALVDLPLAWYGEGETNVFCRPALTENFAILEAALGVIPANRKLLINAQTVKGNRRALIRSMEFIGGFRPACVHTNVVTSVLLPACESCTFEVAPKCQYLLRLEAIDGSGNSYSPAPVQFVTPSQSSGMVYQIY